MKTFEEAYKQGLKGLHAESPGFCSACQDCLDKHDICCEHKADYLRDQGELIDEPHFSWERCDICGGLPGDRHTAHALEEDNEIIHMHVCIDCLLYMANGDLPEQWNA